MARRSTNSPPAVQSGPAPAILLLPRDVVSLVAAEEALELADAYPARGLLDEAQRVTIRAAMGTRADGTWAASTVGRFESRQNGKGDEIQCREGYGLTQLAERVLHSAHEVPTAVEAHGRLVEWFESYDDLRRLVHRVVYANGDQSIELRNGGIVQYKTRTLGGGRGLAEVGLVVVDEAQHAKPGHLAASTPTMAVHPNSQAWIAGSAGFEWSEVAWGLRRNAVSAAPNPRMTYVEHGAQRVWLDEEGRVQLVNPDPFDRAAWARANPAYPLRISDEFLVSQLLRLGPELYSQEHLCVWDPPIETISTPPKLSLDKWRAATVPAARAPHLNPGEVVLGFDVVDGWSSIGIAAGTLAKSYVECIEHHSGLSWLPARLIDLVKRWQPPAVALDGGNGASLAALAEVREAFELEGLDADLLQPLTSAAYRAACGGFATAVEDLKVTRPRFADGQPDQLRVAGEKAVERTIGEAWVWDRRRTTVPLSPLVAVTCARSLLTVVGKVAPKPMLVVSSYGIGGGDANIRSICP